jgi:hypothetical protein
MATINSDERKLYTADEIMAQAERAGDFVLDEASSHPEAWREMTDEEIMATKITRSDIGHGIGVILYGLACVLLLAVLLFMFGSCVLH